MKIINRLNEELPDPIESRKLSVAKLIRIFYATGLFLIFGYFVYNFGQPLVFLEGTGIVSAPRYNVSVPYITHIEHMNVISGIEVTKGDEIAIVSSPEINRDISNLLSEISTRIDQITSLKIRYSTAAGSIKSAESRSNLANRSLDRFNTLQKKMFTIFEHEQLTREASQANISLEEIKAAQLVANNAILELLSRKNEMESLLSRIKAEFNNGVVNASISGVVSSHISHDGDTIVAGGTIAEILDAKRTFIDWYIPNFRVYNPKVNDPVFIIFGSNYLRGYISEILPISSIIQNDRQSIFKDPESRQIARVSIENKDITLPLGSNVSVRMNYIGVIDTILSKLSLLWRG